MNVKYKKNICESLQENWNALKVEIKKTEKITECKFAFYSYLLLYEVMIILLI